MKSRFWRMATPVLVFPMLICAQTADRKPPDTNQQSEMLNKMSQYAENYLSSLPNFLCTQVTVHFTSGLKHLHWVQGDTVVAQLSFSSGKEQQKIQLVNNKVPKTQLPTWHWRLTTAGEFSSQLFNVFAESSKAGFTWKGWDTVQGHPVAVFDYVIQKENSTMTLSMLGVRAVVGYRGTFWGDPDTGQVLRVENQALDIPPELQMEEIGTTIEYGPVTIADRSYFMPVRAEIVEKDLKEFKKNSVEFKDYKQFRADSVLRFDVPDEPKKQ